MRCKPFLLATVFALGSAAIIPSAASAEDTIYVPLMTYRTGAFSASGTPIANGMVDYLNMINARDGGVGGVKIRVEECETGYDTAKGVQCYESVKSKNPIVTTPYSTAITLQVIPKAGVDKVPILSMAYGLSAGADGDVFPWVFNPPSTYWDGASIFVKYVADKLGGLDKLKGKTIGLVYLDAPYGKEPIPLLQELAKDYGFTLKLYPVPAPDMQNQSALWLGIRRDRPDYIYMQGLGAMNPTAVM
jgi:branched-chain amino acid transport system substrate-binding protein